jgi:hypothetical protein
VTVVIVQTGSAIISMYLSVLLSECPQLHLHVVAGQQRVDPAREEGRVPPHTSTNINYRPDKNNNYNVRIVRYSKMKKNEKLEHNIMTHVGVVKFNEAVNY